MSAEATTTTTTSTTSRIQEILNLLDSKVDRAIDKHTKQRDSSGINHYSNSPSPSPATPVIFKYIRRAIEAGDHLLVDAILLRYSNYLEVRSAHCNINRILVSGDSPRHSYFYPLDHACQQGDLATVNVLLKHGVSYMAWGTSDKCPITVALLHPHENTEQIIKLLIIYRIALAQVDRRPISINLDDALLTACNQLLPNYIELFLTHDANINVYKTNTHDGVSIRKNCLDLTLEGLEKALIEHSDKPEQRLSLLLVTKQIIMLLLRRNIFPKTYSDLDTSLSAITKLCKTPDEQSILCRISEIIKAYQAIRLTAEGTPETITLLNICAHKVRELRINGDITLRDSVLPSDLIIKFGFFGNNSHLESLFEQAQELAAEMHAKDEERRRKIEEENKSLCLVS